MSKNQKKYIRFCPQCKSTKVYMDSSNPLQGSMGLPAMYICNECGHSGYSFPESTRLNLKKLKKEKNKQTKITKEYRTPLVDIAYGNFQIRFWWKIISPITFLMGFILFFKEPISGTVLSIVGLVMIYITYFKKRKLKE